MNSSAVFDGCSKELDNFFYGSFESHKRDNESGAVMCITFDRFQKAKIKVPVQDWRRGKEMTGAQITALADHFYNLGKAAK